jgi:glycosyltransferase involved in cell wall biosynthesis
MKKAIWITWENQIRNRSMSALLGAALYVFAHRGSRLKRYILCSYDTIKTVYKNRPDVVIAQNPSIFLNYLLLMVRPFFGFILVSDAHFGGVLDFIGSPLFQRILNFCNRSVNTVIVTNNAHADYIRSIGGSAIVCEDPLPDIDRYNTHPEEIEKMVLFICSFDIDEPYRLTFNAAKQLADDGYELYVTGNYSKVGILPAEYPHVRFLGFVPEHEFYEKLFQASIILDLTEHENCLVCGAYEAMAAEKPLVTSDRKCLRNFFEAGTLFSEHEESSLVYAIKTAYENRYKMKDEIRNWKFQVLIEQERKGKAIRSALGLV